MPKSKRSKPLYQRGGYRLHHRADRENLEIIFNAVDVRGINRERSISAGTGDVEAAKLALDRHYLQNTQGIAICPTCGQSRSGSESPFVASVIVDYLINTETRVSAKAIASRLAHVIAYIATLERATIRCSDIDEAWIERFRQWFMKQPIVSPTGKTRQRTLSTVENSVLQLAAAINFANKRHDTPRPAAFKPIPSTQVNRTPQYRADVVTLIEMFRFATALERRLPLLRFLRLSVVTLGRPDAVHEATTDPKRGQWNAEHAVLDLNPKGRRQTKKVRAIVPIVPHVARELETISGHYVSVISVKKSFASMAAALSLPADGEAGMKLMRRSMANLLRARRVPTEEIKIMLGHRVIESVSELYAPFDPAYCANAKAAIDAICEEIAEAVPNAFYRSFTAHNKSNLNPERVKNG